MRPVVSDCEPAPARGPVRRWVQAMKPERITTAAAARAVIVKIGIAALGGRGILAVGEYSCGLDGEECIGTISTESLAKLESPAESVIESTTR
jgi:hypothetical protein